MIEDGTILRGPSSDDKVLEVCIYKNNQGNWDSIAKVKLLNPALRGQVTQVSLREMSRGMNRGGITILRKEDQVPSTYRRQPGDSPCVMRGTVLRSGDTLFTAIRVSMRKDSRGQWDAAALLQYQDGNVQKTRELTMSELGQAIDSGEFQIV